MPITAPVDSLEGGGVGVGVGGVGVGVGGVGVGGGVGERVHMPEQGWEPGQYPLSHYEPVLHGVPTQKFEPVTAQL